MLTMMFNFEMFSSLEDLWKFNDLLPKCANKGKIIKFYIKVYKI